MGLKMRLRPAHAGVVMVAALVSACSGKDTPPAPEVPAGVPSVAFMADVHFENVYGDLKSTSFAGIPTQEGRNATIRTMYAQLTSTRLFNENYFAFRAALDDAYAQGVRLVALPGDYSDDAQPININGIADLLHEYQAKGMRFFLAPGNHDPNEPYDDDEAGKNDFLTHEGKEQKVYAPGNAACKAGDPSVVCTQELMEQGYEKLLTTLSDFGYMPNKADLHWETPFSQYANGQYSHEEAVIQGALENRQFEMCAEGEGGRYKAAGETALGRAYTRCSSIIDASYLVEPVKGLWLLSIDANVFIPNSKFDPANPRAFKGFDGAGNAGWNKVLTHKKHLLEWIQSVVERARTQGKHLMAFSHYPTMDFYANQTQAMKAVFKPGAFQTARVPEAATTAALAATGLRLHIGGHMHFNGTNDYQDEAGHFLVNVQSPSLAVYGAAYKIVTYKDADTVEVRTIGLNSVPRHDELFPLYQTEYDHLQRSTASGDVAKRWNRAILDTKSYGDFTRYYFGELSRLRFMDEYWPCEMKEAATSLNARQMLILSQLRTRVTLAQLKDAPGIVPLSAACMAKGTATGEAVPVSQLSADWAEATARADALARAAGLNLDDFASITPYEFHGDFHRTVYAGELALRDMGPERVRQYKVLMDAFPASPAEILKIGEQPSDQNPVHVPFQNQFKQVFAIFKGLGSAKPSDHFTIDFKNKKVSNANDSALSFNQAHAPGSGRPR
ncbi:metallophosphoesterase family protein [Cystobacter ferrugineus]|uniref:Metallophosphatase n=1 Tax=Cystobacter ferrugineus TaxID=83449 RepID=A0A1L9BF23_9BACT|nr:metallophosphoesterase [Cystobacter ferrugineus]OJH40818.1 metallophosphatase [Cystobacter ferrugineus]